MSLKTDTLGTLIWITRISPGRFTKIWLRKRTFQNLGAFRLFFVWGLSNIFQYLLNFTCCTGNLQCKKKFLMSIQYHDNVCLLSSCIDFEMLSFSKNSSPDNSTAIAQGFIDCYYFQIVLNHDLRVLCSYMVLACAFVWCKRNSRCSIVIQWDVLHQHLVHSFGVVLKCQASQGLGIRDGLSRALGKVQEVFKV